MRLLNLSALLSAIPLMVGSEEIATPANTDVNTQEEDLNGMTKFIRQKAVHHDSPFAYSIVKQQVPVDNRWYPDGYYHSNVRATAGNYWNAAFGGGAVPRMAHPYMGAPYEYGVMPVYPPRSFNPYEFYGIDYPWDYVANYGPQRPFYRADEPMIRVPLTRNV